MWRHRGHVFASARCSLTSRRSGGRSTTWRRSYPRAATPSSAAWHPSHVAGLCTMPRSGSPTRDKALPGCPGCPPTVFPLRWRRLRGGRRYPSLDGGLLLVRLVVLAWSSSSLTRALSAAICSCCAVTTACNCSITPITASTPPAYTAVISARVSSIVVSPPPHPLPPAAALSARILRVRGLIRQVRQTVYDPLDSYLRRDVQDACAAGPEQEADGHEHHRHRDRPASQPQRHGTIEND